MSDNYRQFDDAALRSAALIVWTTRKKSGVWAEPDASQIAREMVRRGWIDLNALPPKRVEVIRR